MDQEWNKYTHVCHNCDALIEYISIRNVTEITCECGGDTALLSVVGATILPIIKLEKEDKMETMVVGTTEYNPNQLVVYKKITNGETEYITDKVTDIEWALERARQDAKMAMASYEKEVALDEIIKENYLESGDQGTLMQIAELFNISLTKDVEFIATIEISGTVTVDMTDEDALQTLLENSINVSSYDGDLDVSDYILINYEER